ncbi:MAG TPA: HslU--HslV peptidase ATPase subunit, partial [Bacillota bacterium]|nr:HslU--HslV peptidase ATPase subunit [Bacillota bacterium]
FVRILTEPDNALLKQHKALLETEGTKVEFTDDAAREIASMASLMNERTENIGARRLHTIMEKLLEDLSFSLPDPEQTALTIDAAYVRSKFADSISEDDIDRFIL